MDPVATQPLPYRLPAIPAGEPVRVTVDELTGGKTDPELTAELAEALRQIPACEHCKGRHARACPRVKRLRFHPNGSLAEVVFWADGRWDPSAVIWPEEIEAASD